MKLKVAPETLNNIIFIAFHENTIGYHLTFYQTIHRIWLWYLWPQISSYLKRMIRKCPGYYRGNSTYKQPSKSVYALSIDAPFKIVNSDIYIWQENIKVMAGINHQRS